MSLVLSNISKIVDGATHIHSTTLVFEPGAMNVLLGPTLSGKTSLMRLMVGLDKPDTGQIIWNGEDVTRKRIQDRNVAMVYQQFVNYPTLSVFENIASPLRTQHKPQSEIDRAVNRTADLLKLSGLLDRKPQELSGGQQQRCAMARALVKNADLVVMDEPLANLDYKLREELRVEIPKIFAESGSIFVYATTEPEEALLLGGNTATLSEGRVTQFGPTADVYRRPNSAMTARIFSDPPMNFVKIRKEGNNFFFKNAEKMPTISVFENLADGIYVAGFRAHHLELKAENSSALEFDAKLVATEITGSETFIHLDWRGERWIGLIHGVHDLHIGDAISVGLNPSHIYVFDEQGALLSPAAYTLAS